MSYYDMFSGEMADKVKAWKDEGESIQKEIETQRQRVQNFQEMIDEDMEAGSATDETAQNALNLQYAEKRLRKAEAEQAKHEMTPFLPVDEYEKIRKEIAEAYRPDIQSDKDRLRKALDECLAILDDMQAVGHEAAKCEGQLDAAVRDCGENLIEEMKKAENYTANAPVRVVPSFAYDVAGELRKIKMRVSL